MGWGWGGYYRRRSYGYGGGQSKKATANSLSTATIARILREKQEDEARQQQRMADYARQRAEREAAEAKERAGLKVPGCCSGVTPVWERAAGATPRYSPGGRPGSGAGSSRLCPRRRKH